MAEAFTPINTEEEFAAAVAARYGDVEDLRQQLQTVTGQRDTHAKTIEELQSRIKGHETAALRQRIAREKGLPFELASRLTGETEQDIQKDADTMAELLKSVKGPAPLANPEPDAAGSKHAGMLSMLNDLRGE